MSGVSGGSIGSSSANCRRRVMSVPEKCLCGCFVVGLVPKSENNPYCRYYRCEFATTKKLHNDNQCFKWKDEDLVDEIDTLNGRADCHDKLVKEIKKM
ncbi:unnamed protein product [Cochlearia groenlandica]